MDYVRLITDYSDKSFAVVVDNGSYLIDDFKAMGGRFNPGLVCGPGWIFSTAKNIDAITNLLLADGVNFVATELTTEERAALAVRKMNNDHNKRVRKENEERKNAAGRGKATSKTAANNLPLLTDDEKRAAGIDVKSYALRLADNMIITHHPTSLKTEFCFGYSCCGQGHSIKEANELADTARTSEEYFIKENLQPIQDKIDRLNGKETRWSNKHPWIANHYANRNHWEIEFCCAEYISDLRGDEREMYDRGKLLPIASDEKKLLNEFYKYCLEQRRKRCESYLKRFGLSKLRVWTYDSDY